MTTTHQSPGTAQLTWGVVLAAVLRIVVAAGAEVTIFYVLPMSPSDHASPLAVAAMVVAALGLIIGLQVVAIIRSPRPGIRAVELLAASVPLLLLCFAAAYYHPSGTATKNFTQPLGRTDAIYFTTTIFSTVGFGDIAPVSQTARLLVTAQMLVDLVVLGVGLKVITGAVKLGRQRRARTGAPAPGTTDVRPPAIPRPPP